MAITQEELKEILFYEPSTGIFTWKVKRGNIRAGQVAGSIHAQGYIPIGINGKIYQAHQLAVLYMTGSWPKGGVDHINRNRSDNRWKNIRELSQQGNLRNQGLSSRNTSGITGVSWIARRGKWQAQIKVDRKQIGLGLYDNFVDAVQARWDAEQKYGWTTVSYKSTAYEYLMALGVFNGLE